MKHANWIMNLAAAVLWGIIAADAGGWLVFPACTFSLNAGMQIARAYFRCPARGR